MTSCCSMKSERSFIFCIVDGTFCLKEKKKERFNCSGTQRSDWSVELNSAPFNVDLACNYEILCNIFSAY